MGSLSLPDRNGNLLEKALQGRSPITMRPSQPSCGRIDLLKKGFDRMGGFGLMGLFSWDDLTVHEVEPRAACGINEVDTIFIGVHHAGGTIVGAEDIAAENKVVGLHTQLSHERRGQVALVHQQVDYPGRTDGTTQPQNRNARGLDTICMVLTIVDTMVRNNYQKQVVPKATLF